MSCLRDWRTAATPRFINDEFTAGSPGGSVRSGWQISPNGARVVWIANAESTFKDELFSRAVDGSGAQVTINEPLAFDGDVSHLLISPDSSRVAWREDEVPGPFQDGGVFELFSRAIDGTGTEEQINADFVSGILGDVLTDFQFSADSSRLVWRADANTNSVFQIFSRPADASGPQVQLSDAFASGTAGDVTAFQISPDSSQVVWRADANINETFELFRRNINGGDPQIQIADPDVTVTNGDVLNGFLITETSGTVVFRADPETNDVFELFTTGLPVGATATVTGMVLNGGSLNRSGLASLTFQFSEATTVGAAGSLILWNHTTGAALDVSGAALVNNGTNAVTWDLSGIALPDGNYTATLPKAAVALAATHTESFHILPGDSDGDGMVGFGDFGELANSFNVVGGPVYGPGDMDGNGDVGVSDFGILASNFNRTLPALTLDFGDVAESGTSFPTTLANNGARHVLGAGLFLGATVDAEANGQPDANAAGDGGDEDGVTFATLTAGTNAAIAVTATVPGTAMLNAWIDVNADGDWDDTGEKIISDQAVTDGTNNLTAAIPAGAVPGQVLARFRITTDAGHTYSGLAPDGEVEDYQVTLVAAKGSSRRPGPAASLTLWAAAFVAQPTRQPTASVGPQHAADSDGNVVESMAEDIVDLAIAKVASIEPTPPKTEGLAWLDEHLVDQAFNEETGRLLQCHLLWHKPRRF